MSTKRGAESPVKLTLSKLAGVSLIATSPGFYDSAVSHALMLAVEDPSAGTGVTDAQNKLKATENLLQKFPVQPFKRDFIEGFKIRGR